MVENNVFFETSHRTFPSKCDFPMVVIDRDPRLSEPVPSIQWFGRAMDGEEELQLPEGIQFLFGLMISLDAYQWHYYDKEGMEETFRVAFLGKLKDWDPPNAIPGIAKALNVRPDNYVALLSSGEVIVPETLEPSTFAVKVILLGDHSGVIIVPRDFKNLEILQEKNDRIRQKLSKKADEEGMFG